MRRFLIAVVAAAPLWAACSESEVDWSSVSALEGAAASEAIENWRSGLEQSAEFAYPVTLHWLLNLQLTNLQQPLGQPQDGSVIVKMDTTLLGGNNFRSRIVLELAAFGRDEYITIRFESDGQELRISQRGFDALGPIEIPTEMVLSADRIDKVVGMNDLGQLLHPDNMVRFLGAGILQQQSTWRESGDRVQVHVKPFLGLGSLAAELEREELLAASAFTQLADLVVASEFDRDTGTIHSFDSSFDFIFEETKVKGSLTPSMKVVLHGETRDKEVGPVEFRERDKIFDLNAGFDDYWPAIEAYKPLLFEAFRQHTDDQESEQDFSF